MTAGRPLPRNEHVRRQMERMPRRDSGPEIRLRRALYRRGLRYRLHRKDLPGRPDLAVAGSRLAVFVDGCFWHVCPDHGVLPKNNREWWQAKLQATVERDARKDRELVGLGWLPVHVWEHEDVDKVADDIWLLDQERRGRG